MTVGESSDRVRAAMAGVSRWKAAQVGITARCDRHAASGEGAPFDGVLLPFGCADCQNRAQERTLAEYKRELIKAAEEATR